MRRTAAALLALLALPAAAGALPDYRAALAAAQKAVAACAGSPAACKGTAAPADILPPLHDPDVPALRLDWLRAALSDAAKAQPDQRALAMQRAETRLERSLAAMDAPALDDTQAHAAAVTVLSERQFRYAEHTPSWWQLMKARFWQWLNRMLESTADAAEHRPWLGLVVEWVCLAAALAGALTYLLRLARRDRLRVEIAWRGASDPAPQARNDWSALAHEAAERHAWREAIHALYWGAVARLTEAGRWRTAETRTPREYLRLLGSDSPERPPLAELTTLLERAWYAARPATETDYRTAQEQARALGLREGR